MVVLAAGLVEDKIGKRDPEKQPTTPRGARCPSSINYGLL